MTFRLLPLLVATTALARPPTVEDFALRPDCRMELWAAEPDIVSPVGLTFDAAGRAFVLEMRDYPYGMDGKGAAGGTVRLLEDTTGDGKPDKSTLFAEGLHFPTSICAVKDGVLVSAPPDIVFLADRDGDGKAEVREVWFTGFKADVTDSNFNGLRWHMDGRIHGVNGGNGGTITSPRRPGWSLPLADADFLFDPQTFEFALTYPTGGGFGLVFDDSGRSFVTHNINHMQMRILPQSVLDEVPGGSALRGTQNISVHGENCRIFPIHDAQTRPNHPEQAGYFSSSGGMGYLNHSGWPASMANSLFVCDAASGIVHREVLSPDGPIVKSQRPPDEQTSEFLAGRDPAFRPVGIESGPGGALYVIDMQRDVIEHPDYIPPRMKAKIDIRAGSDRGRIWRITPKARLPKPDKLPAKCSVEERVALLRSPNQWTRLTVQRLLLEQPEAKAVPLLHKLVGGGSGKEGSRAALHALWLLALSDALVPADLSAAAASANAAVRIAALYTAAGGRPLVDEKTRVALSALAADPDMAVRWHYLLFGPNLHLISQALRLLESDGANPWMRAAALRFLGLNNEVSQAATHVIHNNRSKLRNPPCLRDIVRAQRRKSEIESLLETAASDGDEAFTAAVEGALDARRLSTAPLVLPGKLVDPMRAARMDGILSLEKAGAVIVAEKPQLHPLKADDPVRMEWLAGILVHAAGPQPKSARWIRLLRHYSLTKTADTLFTALHTGEPPEVQQAALECLRSRDEPAVAERIVNEWPFIDASLRPALAARMAERNEFRLTLAKALVSGAIKPGEIVLDLEQRRELLRHSGPEIRDMVSRFLTDDEYSNRSAVVDQWLAKLPAAGDAVRGRAAFERQCAQCHKVRGAGHEVGPDLTAQSHRSVEDLLTHILDPDAAINPNYAAVVAETTDGQKQAGIVVSGSGANIVLRQAMGLQVEIPRTKLKSLTSTGHSLMPAGQEALFTPQEMRDMIAFLQRRE